MKTSRCLWALFLIMTSLGTTSCSEEDDDSVTINQIPTRPVVIRSNFTLDPTPNDSDSGDEIDVTGPWFEFRFAGTNNTDKKVTIASVVVEVTSREGETNEWTPNLGNGDTTTLLDLEAQKPFELQSSLYVDSLPESESKSYRVKVIFEGWFNKNDDPATEINEGNQPDESFEETLIFNTQG